MAWRTCHISLKALWMHQVAKRGIKFTHVPTANMAADSLTKGLGASSVTTSSSLMISMSWSRSPSWKPSSSIRVHLSVSCLPITMFNFQCLTLQRDRSRFELTGHHLYIEQTNVCIHIYICCRVRSLSKIYVLKLVHVIS